MKTKIFDNNQTRFDLIRAMLTHVPFDGWTWEAMEQGAKDIGFEKKKTPSLRIKIFKGLFKNGSIDFIDTFSEMIDLEVKEKYELIESISVFWLVETNESFIILLNLIGIEI